MEGQRARAIAKIGLMALGTWYGLHSIDKANEDTGASVEYGITAGALAAGRLGVSLYERKRNNQLGAQNESPLQSTEIRELLTGEVQTLGASPNEIT